MSENEKTKHFMGHNSSSDPLISVVVPVYNVEDFLDICLESLIKQTYQNLEIILVDDGSTDGSDRICDKWVMWDERIRVFHKNNGGLSSARNYGIEKARGEYICFLDSDDTLEDFGLRYLYDIMCTDQTDLAIAPHMIVSGSKSKCFGGHYKGGILSQGEALSRMLRNKGFNVSAWSKLYKRKLWDEVRFPDGKLYEDNGTTYKIIMECERISYVEKPFYNYCLRDGSLTRDGFSTSTLDYIELVDAMCDDILNRYPGLSVPVENKRLDVRFAVLAQILSTDRTEKVVRARQDILKYLKSKRKMVLLNNGFNRSTRLAMVSLSCGIWVYKMAWKIYQWRKVNG